MADENERQVDVFDIVYKLYMHVYNGGLTVKAKRSLSPWKYRPGKKDFQVNDGKLQADYSVEVEMSNFYGKTQFGFSYMDPGLAGALSDLFKDLQQRMLDDPEYRGISGGLHGLPWMEANGVKIREDRLSSAIHQEDGDGTYPRPERWQHNEDD